MPVEDVIFCVVPVPGPAGPAGTDGDDGDNGLNAYTVTTASFIMPAEGANVTISVESSAFAVVGQILVITVGASFGHFSVISKPTSTSLEVQNLENTASGTYATNSIPGTSFASGAAVSPAGLQGPAGSAASAGAPIDATYITQTPNTGLSNEQALSGLTTGLLRNITGTGVLQIATLGLHYYGPTMGTAVPTSEGGTGSTTVSGARTNLGLAIGTDVQAFDAGLQSLSAFPTIADRIVYSTGVNVWAETGLTAFARTLLDDVDAAAVLTTLGITAPTPMAMPLYRHEAAAGSNGGTFSGGSWVTVPLNTEVIDTGNHGSISSSEITLAAGTYRFEFGVVAYNLGDLFQGRLYNVTDATVLLCTYGGGTNSNGAYGQVANALANAVGISPGQGRFTLATSQTIRLEARCGGAGFATSGFGQGFNVAAREVWSWLSLEKE